MGAYVGSSSAGKWMLCRGPQDFIPPEEPCARHAPIRKWVGAVGAYPIGEMATVLVRNGYPACLQWHEKQNSGVLLERGHRSYSNQLKTCSLPVGYIVVKSKPDPFQDCRTSRGSFVLVLAKKYSLSKGPNPPVSAIREKKSTLSYRLHRSAVAPVCW